jgi:quercetin dioxygenase-like cupin family protein
VPVHERKVAGVQLERKSFSAPDEVRQMVGKGKVEILKVGESVVGKATFEPGWRWSEHVKPLAGTDSCQVAHLGYVISGRQKVIMDDGRELAFGPGDLVAIPPGHDAEVVGDEPCVFLDFAGMEHYAQGG